MLLIIFDTNGIMCQQHFFVMPTDLEIGLITAQTEFVILNIIM